MKKVRFILCCLLLCFAFPAVQCGYGDAQLSYSKGDTIQDFVFTTSDGESHSLYELLEEKDAVMINIWASWCSPCRMEFPYMQEAYEAYKDKIEIVALSSETTDTPDKLATFAAENNLTFKIGQDSVGFLRALGVGGIPTTLMIDRFGTICYIHTGAQTDAASFERLFDVFVGDAYTESILLDAIPSTKPDVTPSDEAVLTAALGASAQNPAHAYTWPMIAAEKDGRSVGASSNTHLASTRSEISAIVDAKAGEAIVVTFKTSTEEAFDLMSIAVNGKTVKSFGGEHDWMTYAIPVEEDGTYTVKVTYAKDSVEDAGEDTVWIDSITVAPAETALAANPVYPVGDDTRLFVDDPAACEVSITDPQGLLHASFGNASYYVVNAETAAIHAQLAAEADPEKALFYAYYNGKGTSRSLMSTMSETGYDYETNVDDMNDTGYLFSYAILSLDTTGSKREVLILFKDEANLNAFVNGNSLGSWTYVNDLASVAQEETASSLVSYQFKCVDQYGNPVSGVMLQICDAESCQVLVSDANGLCTLEAAPYAWEVHILRAPSGYSADSSEVLHAPMEGGELTLTLTAE